MMKITSIETIRGGDQWYGTASDGVTRYQWFLFDSYFRVMEEERPGSEMWLYKKPPPRAMKRTILQAIRAARH
jgi:hypothetical protein